MCHYVWVWALCGKRKPLEIDANVDVDDDPASPVSFSILIIHRNPYSPREKAS